MLTHFLYRTLSQVAAIFFNLLNALLGGNLPPFGHVTVVVEEQDRYLLIEGPKGKLIFPGGFMRWREPPTCTGIRECEEETGLRVQINAADIVGSYSHISSRFNQMSTLTLVYRGKVPGGELRKSIEGHPCWLNETEVSSRLAECYQCILEDYLRSHAQHSP